MNAENLKATGGRYSAGTMLEHLQLKIASLKYVIQINLQQPI